MMKIRRIVGLAFVAFTAAAMIVVFVSYFHARGIALRAMSPIRDISSLHSSKLLPFGLNCKNGPSWLFVFQVNGSRPGANETYIEISLRGKVKIIAGEMADENGLGLSVKEVDNMRREIMEFSAQEGL